MFNEAMKNIKGFYCGYCDKFHRPEALKKTYTVEVVGGHVTITKVVISCPECGKAEELEIFDPTAWSHLAAMVKAKYQGAVWVKVPLYDSESDLFPKAFKTVTTIEEVEELADWYCIEVKSATIDEFDIIDIEVDFV